MGIKIQAGKKFCIFDVNDDAMDLKTRKLNLIEYLLHVTDEAFFDKIESFIKSGSNNDPFTEEEIIMRAQKANEDYAAGRVLTTEELEEEMKNW